MSQLNKAFETVRVRAEDDIHFVQIHRPQAGNAINTRLIEELTEAYFAVRADDGFRR